MLESSDERLVGQYLKGDEKSLEILIGRYLKPIYSFVYHYVGSASDAEDVAQEVFVRMWRNIKKFDQQRSFKNWIFSIAKNASIDFLKKKKTLPFSHFDDDLDKNTLAENLIEGSPLPNESLEEEQVTNMLSVAIEKLPPAYQEVVKMRSFDNYTFQEIADLTGKSINTIKSQYRRALIFLKKLLSR